MERSHIISQTLLRLVRGYKCSRQKERFRQRLRWKTTRLDAYFGDTPRLEIDLTKRVALSIYCLLSSHVTIS